GNNPAQTRKDESPKEKRRQTIGNRAAHNRVADHDGKKMDSTNDQEPSKPTSILPNESDVCTHRFPQRFVVQCERDLDGAKRDDQSAHKQALDRQIIKYAGNIREVGQENWKPHDQRADHNHDAGPSQNITEAPHGEAEQFPLFKTDAFYPGQTDGDQINLDVNAKEIFENERDCIYRGRNSEQPSGGNKTAPLWQPPEYNLF